MTGKHYYYYVVALTASEERNYTFHSCGEVRVDGLINSFEDVDMMGRSLVERYLKEKGITERLQKPQVTFYQLLRTE